MAAQEKQLLPWEKFLANQDRSETIISMTTIRDVHKNFKWQINGINTCSTHFLQSPTFNVQQAENHSWHLQISCPEDQSICDGYMIINLYHNAYKSRISTSYVLIVRDIKHRKLGTLFETKYFYDYGKGEDLVIEEKILPIDNNILIVELYLRCLETADKTIIENSNNSTTTFIDLNKLLYNDKFSDIVLRSCDGKEIPAHKCLLATASPVFSVMFDHDMKENREKYVDINDADHDTLKALLQFIYTGKFDPEVHGKEEVLIIADKYGMQNLRDLCEIEICNQMTDKNVFNTLVLANKLNLISLKKKSCRFIGQFMKNGLNSDLKNMMSKDPSLFEEILLTT